MKVIIGSALLWILVNRNFSTYLKFATETNNTGSTV